MTLPEKERAAARQELDGVLLRTAVGGVAGRLSGPSDLARRYAAFLEGTLGQPDPNFLPGEEKQKELRDGLRRLFRQPDLRIRFEMAAVMPWREVIDNRLVLRFDMSLLEPNGLFTEGYLEVEGDPATLTSKDVGAAWRVRGLRLLTKKTHVPKMLPPPAR